MLLVLTFALPLHGEGPASPRDVAHPFMLWNAEDVARIRKLVAEQDWAKVRARRLLEDELRPEQRLGIDNLFRFVVFEDRDVLRIEKQALLDFIAAPPDVRDSMDWQWHHVDHYEMALRFDALYHELTDPQRRALLHTFRSMAIHAIEREHLRTWEHYPRMASHSICALVTRDERLIRGLFESRDGLRAYFDRMIDGHFSPTSGNPPHKNLGHLMLWCRGVERLGLDELGFGYRSPSGVSMRTFLQGMWLTADPRIEVPGGRPFFMRSMMRDTNLGMGMDFTFPMRAALPELIVAPLVVGHLPGGEGGWPQWSGAPGSKQYERFMRGEARMHLPLIFELAHRRWPDAGFDYWLHQMREPGADRYEPSLYWGLEPIDPSQVRPPQVKSMVLRELGVAILRAEQSERYWDSPAPVVSLQLPVRLHAQRPPGSYLGLKGFVAFNRPIYRFSHGWGQYDDGANWAAAARAHNTVTVDNLVLGRVVENNVWVMRPIWPAGSPHMQTRHRFDGAMRFMGVRVPVQANAAEDTAQRDVDAADDEGRSNVQQIYPDAAMERCLILTHDYLFDVFHVSSGTPRQYHWLVHALGHGKPEDPGQWQPTGDLARLLGPARSDSAAHFLEARSRDVGEHTWSMTALQTRTPEATQHRLGDGWYDRKVGVRITMLGEPGTTAYYARTPDALGAHAVRERRDPATQRHALPTRDRQYDQADRGITELDLLPLEPEDEPEASDTVPRDGSKPADEAAQTKEESDDDLEASDDAGDRSDGLPRYAFRNVRETGGVSIIAGRRVKETTFVVLHEPFEQGRWRIDSLRRIAQTAGALAVAVQAGGDKPINDRVLLTFGEQPDRVVTLADDHEAFTFTGAVLVRIAADRVDVTGELSAMTLRVTGSPTLHINGQRAQVRIAEGRLHYEN